MKEEVKVRSNERESESKKERRVEISVEENKNALLREEYEKNMMHKC